MNHFFFSEEFSYQFFAFKSQILQRLKCFEEKEREKNWTYLTFSIAFPVIPFNSSNEFQWELDSM